MSKRSDDIPSGREMTARLKALLDSTSRHQFQLFLDFLTAYAVYQTDKDLAYIARIVSSIRDMMGELRDAYYKND